MHYDRVVHELEPGLWHWRAAHPDWRSSEPWDQNVSSYAIDDGERLLLFDPMPPPSELERLAAERETAIVLTCPWHERDSQDLVERLAVPVYTPRPDSAEYLMETYGITAEQAGDGAPDVVWLLKDGIGEAHPYTAGDRLDVGVETFPGQKPNDIDPEHDVVRLLPGKRLDADVQSVARGIRMRLADPVLEEPHDVGRPVAGLLGGDAVRLHEVFGAVGSRRVHRHGEPLDEVPGSPARATGTSSTIAVSRSAASLSSSLGGGIGSNSSSRSPSSIA